MIFWGVLFWGFSSPLTPLTCLFLSNKFFLFINFCGAPQGVSANCDSGARFDWPTDSRPAWALHRGVLSPEAHPPRSRAPVASTLRALKLGDKVTIATQPHIFLTPELGPRELREIGWNQTPLSLEAIRTLITSSVLTIQLLHQNQHIFLPFIFAHFLSPIVRIIISYYCMLYNIII